MYFPGIHPNTRFTLRYITSVIIKMKSFHVRPIHYSISNRSIIYASSFEVDKIHYIDAGIQYINEENEECLCFFLFIGCKEIKYLFLIDGFGIIRNGEQRFENITHMTKNKKLRTMLYDVMFPSMINLYEKKGYDRISIFNKGYYKHAVATYMKQLGQSISQLYTHLPSLAITQILKELVPEWVFYERHKWKKPKFSKHIFLMNIEAYLQRWIGYENYYNGLRKSNYSECVIVGDYVRVLYSYL
jgi:hypothetical protein